jgi:hypothetical protein
VEGVLLNIGNTGSRLSYMNKILFVDLDIQAVNCEKKTCFKQTQPSVQSGSTNKYLILISYKFKIYFTLYDKLWDPIVILSEYVALYVYVIFL